MMADFVKKLFLQFKMSHPNIIQIYDIFPDAEYVYIVEELMFGRSLRTELSSSDVHRKESSLVEKMLNVNSALSYLHNFTFSSSLFGNEKLELVHGDLRP